jgi:hypothetical protein
MKPKMAREPQSILRVSKDVVGADVVNQNGEKVGKIEDLVIDGASSRVTYAIMSFGGFLGVGDKLFAVPWVSLGQEPGSGRFVMKADKELLKDAPGFDKHKWPDLSDPVRQSELNRYYRIDSNRGEPSIGLERNWQEGVSQAQRGEGRAPDAVEIHEQQGPLGPPETKRGPQVPGKSLMDDWGKTDKH